MHVHFVIRLLIALALSSASHVAAQDLEIPGACRTSDAAFSTEEGGCLQFSSGNVFSVRKPGLVSFAEAQQYCTELRDGGVQDWRLPPKSALQAAAGADQARLHLDFKVADFFWSAAGNAAGAHVVDLTSGESSFEDKATFKAAALCMRKPADVDGDGVPDSSDVCNGTPRGVRPETTGPRKGCASDDFAQAANVGCLENSDDFETAGGGCRDRHTGKTWSRMSDRYEDRVTAARFCERFVEHFQGAEIRGWRQPSREELLAIAGPAMAGRHFRGSVNAAFWTSSTGATTQQWNTESDTFTRYFLYLVNLGTREVSASLYATMTTFLGRQPTQNSFEPTDLAKAICVR